MRRSERRERPSRAVARRGTRSSHATHRWSLCCSVRRLTWVGWAVSTISTRCDTTVSGAARVGGRGRGDKGVGGEQGGRGRSTALTCVRSPHARMNPRPPVWYSWSEEAPCSSRSWNTSPTDGTCRWRGRRGGGGCASSGASARGRRGGRGVAREVGLHGRARAARRAAHPTCTPSICVVRTLWCCSAMDVRLSRRRGRGVGGQGL